jgi:hypothetical protein
MCADPQRCCELGNWNTSSANGRLAILGFFEPSSNKNLSEQISQSNIASSFKWQIDASLDEFLFSGGHGCVKSNQIPLSYAFAQGAV